MDEKKCRYCAMMIPKEASICPYCRKQQGFSSGFKAILGIIIFLIVMVALMPRHQSGNGDGSSSNPSVSIGEKGRLKRLSCAKVDIGKDEKSCLFIKDIPGTEFEIEADVVILALGFVHPEKGLMSHLGVEFDTRGNVKTDERYRTSVKGVFAAGDMRRGQSLIVWAISEGRRAARAIDEYLMGESRLPDM